MASWIRIGACSEIPTGGCRVYEAAGSTIAVFNLRGALHAIDSTCIHRGGPLGEGSIEGNIVTCPWHYWGFDVTTGKSTMSPDLGVRKYSLDVRGEDLFVEVHE